MKQIVIRTVLVLALLFVFVVGTLSLIRGFTSSRLERWKRDMRAKGEKFLVSELAPGPVVSNAMIPKLNEALKHLPAPPFARDQIRLMETNKAGNAQVAWRSTNTWQELHKVLDESATRLSAIREAVELKPRDLGWDYVDWRTYPHAFIPIREAAQWLGSAVIIELNRGRRAEALTNLLSLLDLGRCHEYEATFIFQMIRVSLAAMTYQATWEALQAEDWNEPELISLQSAWERIVLGERLGLAIQMERAVILNYYERARRGDTNAISDIGAFPSLPPALYVPIWGTVLSKNDELEFAQAMQRFLDIVRAVLATSSGWGIEKRIPEIAPPQAFAEYRLPLANALIPTVYKALTRWVRTETERQLALAAIGVERYRLRAGRYPEKLAELVPDILKSVPVDFGDGKPLRYEREGDAFRLWSVIEGVSWPQAE